MQWHEVRHQVALSGRVMDAGTGRALHGASVAITAGPAAFMDRIALPGVDRTRTGPDGHFHFLDLPNETYTLAASLPGQASRYGTTEVKARVARDNKGNLVMAAADVKLAPTTVLGKVTGQGGSPLLMAQIRLKGSEEACFTDAQGRYALRGLETGKRTLLFSAPGFQTATRSIEVAERGSSSTIDITLSPVGS